MADTVLLQYEQSKQQAERIRIKRQQINQSSSSRMHTNYKRQEKWVSPFDGSSITDDVDDDKDLDDPAKMACNEVGY